MAIGRTNTAFMLEKRLFWDGTVNGINWTGTSSSYGYYNISDQLSAGCNSIPMSETGSGSGTVTLATTVQRKGYKYLHYIVVSGGGTRSIRINGSNASTSVGEQSVNITGSDTVTFVMSASASKSAGEPVVNASIRVSRVWLSMKP